MSDQEVRQGRSLKQADKVAALQGGKGWYEYLSERFCHGRADWRRTSVGGGRELGKHASGRVYAPRGLMDDLVNQVAVMNAYAALCPVVKGLAPGRVETTLAQLHEMRATTRALRDGVGLAVGKPDEEGPG